VIPGDNFHAGIGPEDVAVDGTLFGDLSLRESLTYDTTGSLLWPSSALKSRPAMIGAPSAAKNPGEIVRNCARGSSSPGPRRWPSAENWKPGQKLPASPEGKTIQNTPANSGLDTEPSRDGDSDGAVHATVIL